MERKHVFLSIQTKFQFVNFRSLGTGSAPKRLDPDPDPDPTKKGPDPNGSVLDSDPDPQHLV
jgi:hypothetical protein